MRWRLRPALIRSVEHDQRPAEPDLLGAQSGDCSTVSKTTVSLARSVALSSRARSTRRCARTSTRASPRSASWPTSSASRPRAHRPPRRSTSSTSTSTSHHLDTTDSAHHDHARSAAHHLHDLERSACNHTSLAGYYFHRHRRSRSRQWQRQRQRQSVAVAPRAAGPHRARPAPVTPGPPGGASADKGSHGSNVTMNATMIAGRYRIEGRLGRRRHVDRPPRLRPAPRAATSRSSCWPSTWPTIRRSSPASAARRCRPPGSCTRTSSRCSTSGSTSTSTSTSS